MSNRRLMKDNFPDWFGKGAQGTLPVLWLHLDTGYTEIGDATLHDMASERWDPIGLVIIPASHGIYGDKKTCGVLMKTNGYSESITAHKSPNTEIYNSEYGTNQKFSPINWYRYGSQYNFGEDPGAFNIVGYPTDIDINTKSPFVNLYYSVPNFTIPSPWCGNYDQPNKDFLEGLNKPTVVKPWKLTAIANSKKTLANTVPEKLHPEGLGEYFYEKPYHEDNFNYHLPTVMEMTYLTSQIDAVRRTDMVLDSRSSGDGYVYNPGNSTTFNLATTEFINSKRIEFMFTWSPNLMKYASSGLTVNSSSYPVLTRYKVGDNTLQGIEYVDLGLGSGTLWATQNFSALEDGDCGRFFQQGDPQGYTKYQCKEGWKTFNADSYNKYGLVKSRTPAQAGEWMAPEEDIIYNITGGKWITPTKDQFDELMNSCDIEAKTMDRDGVSVSIFELTSKINGKKLIFTCDGFWIGSNHDSENTFLQLHLRNYETVINGNNGKIQISWLANLFTYNGCPIRPVVYREGIDNVAPPVVH